MSDRRFRRLCRGALLSGLAVVLVGAALPARAAHADTLRLLTNDNPPFSIIDAGQQVTGISADIVLEMARLAAMPVTVEHYPWARAFDDAVNKPDACIFSTARLPERETKFQWIGPIASNSWALFARPDFHRPLPNLAAARGLVIGGQIQEAKTAYLESQGLTIDAVPNDDLNPRRLSEGRIDLWVTGLYTGRLKAAAVGIPDIKPVLAFRRVDSFLACNLAIPAETIGQLRQALDSMRADGTLAAIARRYGDSVRESPPAGPPVN